MGQGRGGWACFTRINLREIERCFETPDNMQPWTINKNYFLATLVDHTKAQVMQHPVANFFPLLRNSKWMMFSWWQRRRRGRLLPWSACFARPFIIRFSSSSSLWGWGIFLLRSLPSQLHDQHISAACSKMSVDRWRCLVGWWVHQFSLFYAGICRIHWPVSFMPVYMFIHLLM